MDKKSNKKGMGAVIALACAILVVVIILTVAIVSVISENGGTKKNESTTLYTLAGVTAPTKEDKLNNFLDEEDSNEGESVVENQNNQGFPNDGFMDMNEVGDIQSTTNNNAVYDPIAEYEKLTKNGENQLSDHHNNKYIKLVSEKYKVDKELLVAVYSVPDTGSNFVLEFSGKRNEDGNVIKSPDTLTKVYLIDKNKNISVATGKTTGNVGVSYAEGALCFNMVKTIVMPQYPDYFTGVEK